MTGLVTAELVSVISLKNDQPAYIEIQIFSEVMGVRPEARRMVLKEITYDAESGLLEISRDGMNTMILRPVEMYVDQETVGWFITGYYAD